MNRCQMGADITPPNPLGPSDLLSLEAQPVHTGVESCLTYPTNHASWKFSPVPVFPAAGRLPSPRPAAVPEIRTPWRMLVSSAATPGGIA